MSTPVSKDVNPPVPITAHGHVLRIVELDAKSVVRTDVTHIVRARPRTKHVSTDVILPASMAVRKTVLPLVAVQFVVLVTRMLVKPTAE